LEDPQRTSKASGSFPIGHQIKALEWHLGSSVTSLDGALSALDASLLDLGGRLTQLEAQAGQTIETLADQLDALQAGVAALRLGLADSETAAKASSETNARAHATLVEACAELERRLDGVEAIAQAAETTAMQLAQAQQAYRRSMAQELDALSRETTAHVHAELDRVRAAATEAAASADAAAASVISDLRALRQSIEQRFAESEAQTKQRMQAAFEENAQRIAVLGQRLAAGEKHSEQRAEEVRTHLAQVEGGIQSAIEQNAIALRRADATLAADIVKIAENSRVALDALRGDLAADTAALHERQLNATTRLAAAEAKLVALAQQAEDQRSAVEERLSSSGAALREALHQVDVALSEQADASASRATELEQDIAHVRRSLGAEISRVEACTLAALEKQARDRISGEAANQRALEHQAASTRVAVEDMRRRMDEQLAGLQGAQAKTQSRLDAVDAALANDGPLATVLSATADEVASLRTRVLALQATDREVADRMAKLEKADDEALKALESLRQRFYHIVHQIPPDPGAQLLGLEKAVAELKILQSEAADAQRLEAQAEALGAIQSRLSDLEDRQAEGLQRLRNDIGAFIADNERRLALLEDADPAMAAAPLAALEQRLAELEGHDIGVAFAELRARIEERVLGVEQRNVRTLEQLSDTVALIERRFSAGDDSRAAG
jgi:hypothetical protein